jgi:hypothetical protein
MLNPLLKDPLEHLSGLAVHGLAREGVVQEAIIEHREDLLVATQRGTTCRGTSDDTNIFRFENFDGGLTLGVHDHTPVNVAGPQTAGRGHPGTPAQRRMLKEIAKCGTAWSSIGLELEFLAPDLDLLGKIIMMKCHDCGTG